MYFWETMAATRLQKQGGMYALPPQAKSYGSDVFAFWYHDRLHDLPPKNTAEYILGPIRGRYSKRKLAAGIYI